MAVLVDSYSESNRSNDWWMYGGDIIACSQSFTGTGGILNYVQFYLSKSGSPTGTCYAKIYAHTGTFGTSSLPTGAVLATSGAITVASLSTSQALVTYTFSGAEKITLTNTTKYVVVLDVTFTSSNASNRINFGMDDVGQDHAGNMGLYVSSWTASDRDACFYVYADDPTTSTTSTSSSTTTTSISTTSTSISTTTTSSSTSSTSISTTTTSSSSSTSSTSSSTSTTSSSSSSISTTTTSSSTSSTSSSSSTIMYQPSIDAMNEKLTKGGEAFYY